MRSRLQSLAVLTALLLVSVPFGWLARGLHLDEDNAAMKSVATPQSEAAARRRAEFGEEHVLVLLLEPRASVVDVSPREPSVKAWLSGLRARSDVERLRVLPRRGQGALLATVTVRGDAEGKFSGPVRAVADWARANAPPIAHLSITGQPVAELALSEALDREQGVMVPAIAAALFVLLLLHYRHLGLALGALLPAGLAILWTAGTQALLDVPLDPVSTLLAPVLLTVGVAGSVHVIERFLAHRAAGAGVETAARKAVGDLVRPALLAVLTTAAGFLGLTASAIPALQHLGLLSTFGVLLSAGLALRALPAWLSLFAGSEALARRRRANPLRGPGPGLAAFLAGAARPTVAVAAVLLAVFATAWGSLRVDTDPLRLLPENHRVRVETARIAEHLGGIDTFELLLPQPGPAAAPARALALGAELAADPEVVSLLGPPRRSPRGTLLLHALLRPGGTTTRTELFARVEALARAQGWPDAAATGASVQVARDSTELVLGQQRGMLLTLLLLWLAMAVGFRSAGLATLGLIPNVVPSVLIYGGMSLASHPLSVASAMIGSVMLGLVVDDTIHFLHGYGLYRRRGCGRTVAVARTLRRTGRALVITSVVLTTGFATGLLGSLSSTREFGLLAAITITAALLADLLLLPALLLLPRTAAEEVHEPVLAPATP